MSDETFYPAEPDYAVAPGEILADFLDDREISVPEAAVLFNTPIDTLVDVLHGKCEFPVQLAESLESLYQIPAVTWFNLDTSYQRMKADREDDVLV